MPNNVYDDLLQELPRLRRHACLLLGSAVTGDQLIEDCLERAVVACKAVRRSDGGGIRLALFRAFHDRVAERGVQASGTDVVTPGRRFPESAIRTLPQALRRALLLVAVEQFRASEAAEILRMTEFEVRRDLRDARAAIARMAVPVLILEDEWLIGEQLRHDVEKLGYWVCGTARRFDDAIAQAERTPPGLVLADVSLADGAFAGIAAAETIRSRYNGPVIYITGFPERVLEHEMAGPSTVIPKPMNPGALKTAMRRALHSSGAPHAGGGGL